MFFAQAVPFFEETETKLFDRAFHHLSLLNPSDIDPQFLKFLNTTIFGHFFDNLAFPNP